MKMTSREAIKQALIEEMKRDSSVYLLGEDLADPMGGSLKVTLGISTEFVGILMSLEYLVREGVVKF